jgi:hypothetical protein
MQAGVLYWNLTTQLYSASNSARDDFGNLHIGGVVFTNLTPEILMA